MINVDAARLVPAHEVDLVLDEDGAWRVAGIDPSIRPRLWRLLPAASAATTPSIDSSFHGVTSSRSSATCRPRAEAGGAPARPAASRPDRRPGRGRLARGGGGDPRGGRAGQGARGRRVRGARRRAPGRVPARALRPGSGRRLPRMESDDAADLLMELEQGRRLPILNLLPGPEQPRSAGCSATTRRPRRPDEPRLHLVLGETSAAEALARSGRATWLQQIAIVCVADDGAGCSTRSRWSSWSAPMEPSRSPSWSSLHPGVAPRPRYPSWRG